MPAIWTIGYEQASFKDFLATLQEAGVAAVLDVRDFPSSRRAGFSKSPLSAGLAEAGIAYHHLKGLGTPKEGRTAARTGDMAKFWRIVDAQLAKPEAEHDLQRAAAIAAAAPSCLLCYEADHRHCHRLRVAEAMQNRFGLEPFHLAVRPSFL